MDPSITAIISKEWKQRMLIIVAVTAGMGGWFLLDGLLVYPKNNERYPVYAELEEQLGADTPEFQEAWKTTSAERGWADTKPKPIYTDGEIRTQVILAILMWAGTAAILVHFFRSLPRTTRLEGKRLVLPDGREIDITTIRAVSKKRWESKSIADVVYEPSPGEVKKFLLDDYKFIGAAEILQEIEKTLPTEDEPT